MTAAQYGNIGSDTRLDFTVIGRDVNIAARIESLCGVANSPLLASEAFATHVDGLHFLETHTLKGIADPVRVYSVQPGAG